MKMDKCGEGPGLCDAMKHIENPTVIEYLSKVQFKGTSIMYTTFFNN